LEKGTKKKEKEKWSEHRPRSFGTGKDLGAGEREKIRRGVLYLTGQNFVKEIYLGKSQENRRGDSHPERDSQETTLGGGEKTHEEVFSNR